MQDNDFTGDNSVGREVRCLRPAVEVQRHQDRIDRHALAQILASPDTLALEAERFVESERRLIPWEDMQLDLAHVSRFRPRDRLLEQGPAHTQTTMARGNHQAQVSNVAARRMNVARERQPRNDAVAVLGHIDGRVRMTADGTQVAPLLGRASPRLRGQEPRAGLAADLARELDKRLRIARLSRADPDQGTTTP